MPSYYILSTYSVCVSSIPRSSFTYLLILICQYRTQALRFKQIQLAYRESFNNPPPPPVFLILQFASFLCNGRERVKLVEGRFIPILNLNLQNILKLPVIEDQKL